MNILKRTLLADCHHSYVQELRYAGNKLVEQRNAALEYSLEALSTGLVNYSK
jgi:hypothetical protein